jgi:neutral ceramidase
MSCMRIAGCLMVVLESLSTASGAVRGPLRVGAARVDITPEPGAALPMGGYGARTGGFKGIHDHIYVRAIVLDDGTSQAALLAWELIAVPDSVWASVSQRITGDFGIRPENLVLAAVHDHGAPSIGPQAQPAAIVGPYTKKVEDAAAEAVRLAKQRLQPARYGIGTGTAYVNINRRELAPDGTWRLGYNDEGPSDKTVTVLRFEDLSGKPIAFFINYPVHAVVMGPKNLQITGDLAGATSRFVEQHYLAKDQPRSDAGPRVASRPEETASGDGVVAVWTSGAAGDQNAVSLEGGEDFTMVDALGKILGEAAVRAASAVKTTPQARIWGAQKVVTCPGRQLDRASSGPRTGYKWNDSDPVNLRLSLLMIDDIAISGVSGEVFTLISRRLRKNSPFNHTIMVTHANGSSGYVPDDSAFDQISYEVTSSHLKPGCAENAIVNGLLDLMQQH